MSDRDHSELDARLDEAFRRLPDTDDLRDLKDELRASLIARADELAASGTGPTAAVAQAFVELGDIDALLTEVAAESDSARGEQSAIVTGVVAPGAGDDTSGNAVSTDAAARARRAIDLMRRHKVRPKPAFVVRTVVLSLVTAAGLVLTVLAAFGILGWPLVASVAVAVVLLAAPVGVLVGDGVHQETTANFPVPDARAASYGVAAFLGVAGLSLAALFVGDLAQPWLIAVAAPLIVVSGAWFSYLGATQTNRTKPWMRHLQGEYHGTDRFSQDEAAAARFGIYTAVIFVVAIAVFIVLSFTIGFLWSWLALVAGFVVFFLVLARMLFPSGDQNPGVQNGTVSDTADASRTRHDTKNGPHHD